MSAIDRSRLIQCGGGGQVCICKLKFAGGAYAAGVWEICEKGSGRRKKRTIMYA